MVSPASVGSSPPEPSSSGGLRRRSGWSQSSRPLRPRFNAGSIIARPRSVHGFERLCWATTNTMPFQATRRSCAFLPTRLPVVGECPHPSQSTRPGALGPPLPSLEPMDSSTPHSGSLSRCPLRRYSSSVRAVCVNALVRICAGAISDGRPYRDNWTKRYLGNTSCLVA